MTETTYPGVLVRRDGHLAELVLNRPEAHNALSTQMARGVAWACADLMAGVAADRAHGPASDVGSGQPAGQPAVRAVVLSSASPTSFCVGADLKERSAITDADLMRQRLDFRAAFGGVLGLPVPAVAAVHGHALGGGFELALCCDLIVVDETAVVGLPEVSVGLVPGGGGTQLLARRVGYARAADLILTGRRVGAGEAERLGLADRRVPAGQARQAALDLAGLIAGNSPVGVRNAKHALRRSAGVDLATGLDIEDAAWRATAFSGDRREGISAFIEKRSPNWPGE